MTNNSSLCSQDTPASKASALLGTLVGDLFLDVPMSDLVGSMGDILLGQMEASRNAGGQARCLPNPQDDGVAATPSTNAERRAA